MRGWWRGGLLWSEGGLALSHACCVTFSKSLTRPGPHFMCQTRMVKLLSRVIGA